MYTGVQTTHKQSKSVAFVCICRGRKYWVKKRQHKLQTTNFWGPSPYHTFIFNIKTNRLEYIWETIEQSRSTCYAYIILRHFKNIRKIRGHKKFTFRYRNWRTKTENIFIYVLRIPQEIKYKYTHKQHTYSTSFSIRNVVLLILAVYHCCLRFNIKSRV